MTALSARGDDGLGLLDLCLPSSLTTGVATLGPPGTSSQSAARHLTGTASDAAPLVLTATYEQARDEVVQGRAELLVVANAYAGINAFYMDPKLRLAGAFVMDTPLYGLAVRSGRAWPGSDSVAVGSHPAPVPLIDELCPPHLTVGEVVPCISTSAAAARVARGEFHVALTTAPAAAAFGLLFVSRTRPIRMLWSVFRAATDPGRLPARSRAHGRC